MSRIKWIFQFTLFALFLNYQTVLVADKKLPEPEVLSGMNATWAAENIKYNGIPASIKTFVSSDSPQDIIRQYEGKWRVKGLADKTLTRIGDLQILGLEKNGVYYTVQVRESSSGGSEGTLAVSQSPINAVPNATSDFPFPGETDILIKLESDDFGQLAETITAMNHRSIKKLQLWYKMNMDRDGWSRQDFGNTMHSYQGALYYQKGNQLCQISFKHGSLEQDGKTIIVVNWMK